VVKTIRILAILLVIQLIFIGIGYIENQQMAASEVQGKLLNFRSTRVDQIIIRGRDKHQVTVKLQHGKWQMADGFPANTVKINQLISQLHALKRGLPIATSTAAKKRFKVADDDFAHQLVLKHGNSVVASLYLGTGAGAQRSYGRVAGAAAIYSVELGGYDVVARQSFWQDKTLLQLGRKDLTGLNLGSLNLRAEHLSKKVNTISNASGVARSVPAGTTKTSWITDNLPNGKILNQQAINTSLAPLLSLRFSKVLGKQLKAGYGLDKPVLELTLRYQNGQRGYRFGKQKKTGDYVLKVSDHAQYFQLPAYIVEPLIKNISTRKWLRNAPTPVQKKIIRKSDSKQQPGKITRKNINSKK